MSASPAELQPSATFLHYRVLERVGRGGMGTVRRVSDIPPDCAISNNMSWAGRLTLSYDGKSLVTAVSRATGDIWIADGIRPPQTWWSRLMGRR